MKARGIRERTKEDDKRRRRDEGKERNRIRGLCMCLFT
jgi:hypothetical protein